MNTAALWVFWNNVWLYFGWTVLTWCQFDVSEETLGNTSETLHWLAFLVSRSKCCTWTHRKDDSWLYCCTKCQVYISCRSIWQLTVNSVNYVVDSQDFWLLAPPRPPPPSPARLCSFLSLSVVPHHSLVNPPPPLRLITLSQRGLGVAALVGESRYSCTHLQKTQSAAGAQQE